MGNIVVKCDDDKDGKAPIEAKTQWDGAFEFKDVSGSKHTLTVELKGYVKQSKTVHISRSDDNVTVDFDMVEAKGSGSISGHVYDDESKLPMKQGHVSMVLPGGNKYAELDYTGRYEFTGLAPDTYELWAAPTGYYEGKQAFVTLAESENKTQDFFVEVKSIRIW